MKDREVITIIWNNGSKEFAVIELNKESLIYDKLVATLGYNALKGDLKKAKCRFKNNGVIK